jgi:hypothetical protein
MEDIWARVHKLEKGGLTSFGLFCWFAVIGAISFFVTHEAISKIYPAPAVVTLGTTTSVHDNEIESIPKDNGVYIITDSTFDEFIALDDKGVYLVEFYAPGCGHCKQLAPVSFPLDNVSPFLGS